MKFQENWNSHPISGKGGNLSPLVGSIKNKVSMPCNTEHLHRTSDCLGIQNLGSTTIVIMGPSIQVHSSRTVVANTQVLGERRSLSLRKPYSKLKRRKFVMKLQG